MNLSKLLLLLLGYVTIIEAGSSTIVDLTENNFNTYIERYPYVMIVFYAPWCGHCQKFEPIFKKVAEEMKRSTAFARVDVTKQKKIAKRYQINGFPTLKWFVQGNVDVSIRHAIPREKDALVQWIERMTKPTVTLLSDSKQVLSFRNDVRYKLGTFRTEESQKITVVAFLDHNSNKIMRSLEQSCRALSAQIACGAVREVSSNETIRPSIVVYRSESGLGEEDTVRYEGDLHSTEELTAWLRHQSLPLLLPFDARDHIFRSGVAHQMLVFVESATHPHILETVREAAAQYRGEVVFLHVPSNASRVLTYFRLSPEDFPTFRLLDTTNGKLRRYPFPSELEITTMNLIRFVAEMRDGKGHPEYRSQPVPKQQDSYVLDVVSATFDEIVLDTSKHVVVFFYTSWCGHCETMQYDWLDVADHFATNREDIVFARMDGSKNEHQAIEFVRSFPTVALWPRKSKGEPEIYHGSRTAESIIEFVDTYSPLVVL